MHADVKLAPNEKVKWSEVQEEDIQKLVQDIKSRSVLEVPWAWPNPALNVIDCVLSLRNNYQYFVLPRVRMFKKNRPEFETLESIQGLIEQYKTPYEFGKLELDYKYAARMQILLEVTKQLIKEELSHAGLDEWVNSDRCGDEKAFGVHGFGPAGFQYLRVLFGAQTFKPDMHILAYVEKITGRKPPTPNDAVALLKEAATRAKVAARDLDFTIWREGSGATFTES